MNHNLKDLKFWSKKQKHWQKELKNLGLINSIFDFLIMYIKMLIMLVNY